MYNATISKQNTKDEAYMESKDELLEATRLLKTGDYTCVLCCGKAFFTTRQRGVRPLVQWLEQGNVPKGFCAADKVVGKATAFLYCLLGAKAVYANVMSRSAQRVLKTHGILAHSAALVDYIENRTGDGICPFEAAVLEIDTPEQALTAIYAQMWKMGMNNIAHRMSE